MENKKRSISTKTFAILLAVVLIIGCMAGGTIAWLIDSKTVTNTFTYGDINITLLEHGYNPASNVLTTETVTEVNNYTIIPGRDLPKDPTVTVKAGSEACWLFVKVEKNELIGDVTWTPAEGWTKLEDGVYYRQVDKSDVDQLFQVIANNKISVSSELTKAKIDALESKTAQLVFKAYAVQKESIADAATAWAKANA